MIFKKPSRPPSHFRQFVAAKESWEAVHRHLMFMPKTENIDLRQKIFEAETSAALASAYSLLAVELFDIILKNDSRIIETCGEEVLLLECLAFSSSFVCNRINPDSDDYETYLNARHSIHDLFPLMSLLDDNEIELTLESRFDLYDRASSSSDIEGYLIHTLAQVLSYLADGHHFSQIQVRHEDPLNHSYVFAVSEFSNHATKKLKEIVSRTITRETNESWQYET